MQPDRALSCRGDGTRLFDNPGGAPVRLHLVNSNDPTAAVNVRYRPIPTT